MFSMNFEFFQNIHWEYVLMFIIMLGFVAESFILYIISKQNDKIEKEHAEVKARYEALTKENEELAQRSRELIQQLSDQLDSAENMMKKVRS